MTRQRWGEIHREEGFSQWAINSLWEDKPATINISRYTEEDVRATARFMKELHPEWATREDDKGWEREE